MSDPLFEVIEPGLLSTVQDAGRADLGHLGVPRGGAADGWSMAVANFVLGNPLDAAVLECTLIGPELRVLRDMVVSIAGADLGATVRPGGRRLDPGASHRLTAGEVLAFSGGDAGAGARAYLAVPGGIDVPVVLGSRSTCLVAGFGGLEGRALRAGDVLAPLRLEAAPGAGVRWRTGSHDPRPGSGSIRIVGGPDATPAMLAGLTRAAWTVSLRSDRRGLRLEGPAVAAADATGERLTAGVVPGAVQLPPDGSPIVLLCDAQPTGGYPVIAVVIEADLPLLGQLAPGMSALFAEVTLAEARVAALERRAALAAGSAAG
jgi:biotin-dependent carboxylase-like uncharacterized protein